MWVNIWFKFAYYLILFYVFIWLFRMMQLFRKYLVDNGHRDALNRFNAYWEARQYMNSNDDAKKHTLSNQMMKFAKTLITYLKL